MPVRELLERETGKLSPIQATEMGRMKLRCNNQKTVLAQKLDSLETQVMILDSERYGVTGDRLKRPTLEKQATQLRVS